MILLGWFKNRKEVKGVAKTIAAYLSGKAKPPTGGEPIPLDKYDAVVAELKQIAESEKPIDLAASEVARELLDTRPPDESPEPLTPFDELGPSDLEKARFLNRVELASNPALILHRLQAGRLGYEDAAAVAELVPEWGDALQAGAIDGLADYYGSTPGDSISLARVAAVGVLTGLPPKFFADPPAPQPKGGEAVTLTPPDTATVITRLSSPAS